MKLLLLIPLILSIGLVPIMADAHQSGCHRWHSCPSDAIPPSYVCGDTGHDNYCPVVINEVEMDPNGSPWSSSVWVELYNPSSKPVDIGGMSIISTSFSKTFITFPDNGQVIIFPHSWITLSQRGDSWFNATSDSIKLVDDGGNLIDKTPILSDEFNTNSSWQRIIDGYDTDSFTDWKFAGITAGNPNSN